MDSCLRSILGRETSISVGSFVGQYLPVLDLPQDVVDSLESGQINLFEAHQLALLTARRLTRLEREAHAAAGCSMRICGRAVRARACVFVSKSCSAS